MNITKILAEATGGRKDVAPDWASATSLRPFLQDDPCLVWLKLHGDAHGFEKDLSPYSFLNFVGDIGSRFEAKWIREVTPEAIAANATDHDVRRIDSLRRTLDLMRRKVPVIAKAALWWAPFSAYGTADLIARASWLRKKFPCLTEHIADGTDHYCVLDCKFQTNLDKPHKKRALQLDAAQVRLYSALLGSLQGVVPQAAFLITRDRPLNPLPIMVEHELGGSLDPEVMDLIRNYQWIARNGGRVTPWSCPLVRPNFANHEDAPWSMAKKAILSKRWLYTPLEMLPHVGSRQATALRNAGYASVEDLLAASPDEANAIIACLPGFGSTRAATLRALLDANWSGRPTHIRSDAVPPKHRVELAVDFEFLSNLHVNPERDWPDLSGRAMVFAVGVAFDETHGERQTQTFLAGTETPDAEREMWSKFLRFLRKRGVHTSDAEGRRGNAALYHWSAAEPAQARAAAKRLDIPELARLPWVDLRPVCVRAGVALPGMWNHGLKSVASALGAWSPEHAVTYPAELASGMDAQVMAWRAYEQDNPLDTQEMGLIDEYLRTDCLALWQILRWMRATAGRNASGWQ